MRVRHSLPSSLLIPTSVAALERAVEDAADRDAAEKFAVVEVHHLNLQRAFGIARGRRNALTIASNSGSKIFGIVADLVMGDAVARVGIDHGEIELIFGGVEIDEQVIDFIENFRGARVDAVDFVQHDDRRQLGGQRLLQDVAGLRQRAFAGVHEKDHAIHHAQRAFDFAAEIAVARRVDDVDLVS